MDRAITACCIGAKFGKSAESGQRPSGKRRSPAALAILLLQCLSSSILGWSSLLLDEGQ
jgi:hypothetical protein